MLIVYAGTNVSNSKPAFTQGNRTWASIVALMPEIIRT